MTLLGRKVPKGLTSQVSQDWDSHLAAPQGVSNESNLHQLLRVYLEPCKLTMLMEGCRHPRASPSLHSRGSHYLVSSHIHSYTTRSLCCPLSPHCLVNFSYFLSPLLWHKPHTVGPLSGPPSGPCLAYTGHTRNICGTNVYCLCLSKIAGLFADAQSLPLGKSHILQLLEIMLRATSLSPSQPHGLVW